MEEAKDNARKFIAELSEREWENPLFIAMDNYDEENYEMKKALYVVTGYTKVYLVKILVEELPGAEFEEIMKLAQDYNFSLSYIKERLRSVLICFKYEEFLSTR